MHASDADIKHFLVTYDTSDGTVAVRDFGTDYESAVTAYGELEGELRDDSKFEIVLLSADSIETLKRTHSSYFGTEPSFEHLLPDGVLN